MPAATRSAMEARIDKTENDIQKITSEVRKIKDLPVAMEDLKVMVAGLVSQLRGLTDWVKPKEGKDLDIRDNNILPRTARLDFPLFSGNDPNEWVFHIEKFFFSPSDTATDRMLLASYHLKGEANQLYQWCEGNNPGHTWDQLKKDLLVRFGPTAFED